MVKNPLDKGDVLRDKPPADEWTGRDQTTRVILFPTEPSTIGHDKIDRAIERVLSRRR